MSEALTCPRCDGPMVEGVTNVTVKKGGRFTLALPHAVGVVICERCGYMELYYGKWWMINKALPEEVRRKIQSRIS